MSTKQPPTKKARTESSSSSGSMSSKSETYPVIDRVANGAHVRGMEAYQKMWVMFWLHKYHFTYFSGACTNLILNASPNKKNCLDVFGHGTLRAITSTCFVLYCCAYKMLLTNLLIFLFFFPFFPFLFHNKKYICILGTSTIPEWMGGETVAGGACAVSWGN